MEKTKESKDKMKSKKEYKELSMLSAGAAISVGSGVVVEKKISPLFSKKILEAKKLRPGSKIVFYRGAQSAVKSVAGIGATLATCSIAEMLNVKKDSLSSLKKGGFAGAAVMALVSLFPIKDGFGEKAQTPEALLIEENKRLGVSNSSSTATSGTSLFLDPRSAVKRSLGVDNRKAKLITVQGKSPEPKKNKMAVSLM